MLDATRDDPRDHRAPGAAAPVPVAAVAALPDADAAHLADAVELARRSPCPDPNPQVGAVVVRDGVVVGRGWHHGAGTPHAEVEALRDAGESARSATAFVSLEPCDHTGRTGPCTRALVDAGIARVVYAQADPFPDAAGGAATLRAAGVAVEHAPLRTDVNREWLVAMARGRPFVTWKYAATLDGRSAAADGTSRWITGEAARDDVHRLRARCGAVVVGTGTVLADDPALTVRGHAVRSQPLRVVVGSREIPSAARVLDGEAECVRYRDPATALAGLHERGVRHVLLEGGPTLAAAFWRAGLVDEVVAYVAPALLGAGPTAVGDLGVSTIADAARLRLVDVTRLGDDVRLTLTP